MKCTIVDNCRPLSLSEKKWPHSKTMFELAEILTEQRQNVKLRFKKREQFS